MRTSLHSIFFLFMLSMSAFSQSVSGRYRATLHLGGGNEQTVLLIVDADGSPVRGSIGPDETHRFFFTDGTAQDNTLSFNAAGISTVLTFTGTTLSGFASPPGASSKWAMSGTRIGDLTLQDRFAPLPNEDAEYRSSTIIRVRDAMRSKVPNAEQAFWAQIRKEGAPIVEPVAEDATRSLVTFVWHGSGETKSVLLQRGRFSRFQPQQNLFAHVDGTDIWFKTLILPSASRFQYAFSENDPSATFPRGPGQSRDRYDPLNPKHLPEGNAPESAWHSLVELPSAARQPWYKKKADIPKYEENDAVLQSHILDEKRELKIYLPPGYKNTTEPLPVLYLFDGEDPDGLVFATWTLENLIAARQIPPVVIVRVVNPSPALREKELGCSPAFADFMSKELVSFVRAHYRVTSNSALTGVGGYSRGGLAAAYVALRNPESFGLVLAQSGAFWWEPNDRANAYLEPNWLAKQYVNHPKVPIRFYLEAGLFELDLHGSGGDILETTRTLRDVLQAKGYAVSYQEFAGDHDYINWRGTFADGMIALFGNSSAIKKGQ